MTITWPKNPKIDDIVAIINTFDVRVTMLEEAANSDRHRLDVLDRFMASHSAGAVGRQQEVDQLRAENQRLRWAMTNSRKL